MVCFDRYHKMARKMEKENVEEVAQVKETDYSDLKKQ